MLPNDLKEIIFEYANKSDNIAIVTHKNPDGDGLPAALALKEILKKHSIDSEIVLENSCPSIYNYLDGRKKTLAYSEKMFYEFLILIDCHEEARIGKCSPLVKKAKKIVAIDHHIKKNVIDEAISFIDPSYVSAGAIIFKIFENELKSYDGNSQKYIADCIYSTILNDTDNFTNQNIDSETFNLCAHLYDLGINPGKISQALLYGKSPEEMKFTGQVLSTIETYENHRILFINSTMEMLEKLGLDHNATSKMTKWLKGTKGVKAIVYFREIDKNYYRLSLRSDYLNVNTIAENFGGGGHSKAAGCEIKGNLKEIQNYLKEWVED